MKMLKFLANKLGLFPKHIEGKLYQVQGFHMYLTENEHIQSTIINNGVYEGAETELLPNFIESGISAVDVGANIGYYSLLLSRLVGQDGHVYAFEPLPVNFERLKVNIELNVDNVEAINMAIGDSPKVSRYCFIPSTNRDIPNLGGWSMVGTESDGGNIVVETTTLDDFVQKRDIQNIQFLKIDVEGFELQVLKGARETIQLFRPAIMIEYLATQKTGTDRNVRDIQEYMNSMNYTVYRIHKRPKPHIKLVTSEDFKMPVQFNAICHYGGLSD